MPTTPIVAPLTPRIAPLPTERFLSPARDDPTATLRCAAKVERPTAYARLGTGRVPMKDSRRHRGLRRPTARSSWTVASQSVSFDSAQPAPLHLHEAARLRTTRPLRLLTRQSGKARPRVLLAP